METPWREWEQFLPKYDCTWDVILIRTNDIRKVFNTGTTKVIFKFFVNRAIMAFCLMGDVMSYLRTNNFLRSSVSSVPLWEIFDEDRTFPISHRAHGGTTEGEISITRFVSSV